MELCAHKWGLMYQNRADEVVHDPRLIGYEPGTNFAPLAHDADLL